MNKLIISSYRLMNNSKGEVVKCVRFKDMNLEELNRVLSNEFFTLNETDEESLVLGLRAREEFYANRDNNHSFNGRLKYFFRNCTASSIKSNLSRPSYSVPAIQQVEPVVLFSQLC